LGALITMPSTPDKVIYLLKNAKTPSDYIQALAQDPALAIGIVGILFLIGFFIRVLIWPEINPFQFKWFSDFWDWLTAPTPPTPTERYPYAKVIYPTYR
jgi:hypothetical protein